MNKIALAKLVTTTIVGAGTTKIVSAVVKNNTNPETLADKVSITASSMVIGAMVADKAKQYTDTKIDEVVDAYHKLANVVNKKTSDEEK